MFEPKMLQSNAAHLVQKVSENAVHRLDHGVKEKKAVRTSKVMMGPRYERPMRSRPEPKEVSPEDKDAAQQLEDAERLVRPTSCCPRHLLVSQTLVPESRTQEAPFMFVHFSLCSKVRC